jgi:tetratricopeptide (TPR) repeat protein
VAEIVALLRHSGWDAFTLLGVAGALREQAAEADPAAQEDLRHALFETYDRHFSVPGEDDLPFTIGLLLFELEDYEDAIEFFEASLEQHGPDPATERNIELCEAQLEATE